MFNYYNNKHTKMIYIYSYITYLYYTHTYYVYLYVCQRLYYIALRAV